MTVIQRLSGETYNLRDLGIRTRDIIVSSPPPRNYTGQVDGRDGLIDYGTDYDARPIIGRFTMFAVDLDDYVLLRDEVFNIFSTKEPFYFIDSRYPVKRWKVKTADSFDPERANRMGKFDVNMIAYLPFAESIGTSQTIQNNGIDANDALWGFGMGLIADDDSLIYTHTGTSFRIYNAGNVAVHPFQQELKLTIDNVQGSTSYLQLRNITNGSVFRINEAVTNSQTIVIDRMNMSRNGLAIFRKTNRKYIELESGWNEFEVTGATSARVAFDFRYYYK